MKYIKNLSISFLIAIMSLLLLLFLVTIFNYFDLFNHKVTNILIIMIPILSLILGGFYIGKKAIKRGYLEGLKLGIIFILIIVIINLILQENFNLKDIIFYLILLSSSIFGSMVGINSQKKS